MTLSNDFRSDLHCPIKNHIKMSFKKSSYGYAFFTNPHPQYLFGKWGCKPPSAIIAHYIQLLLLPIHWPHAMKPSTITSRRDNSVYLWFPYLITVLFSGKQLIYLNHSSNVSHNNSQSNYANYWSSPIRCNVLESCWKRPNCSEVADHSAIRRGEFRSHSEMLSFW